MHDDSDVRSHAHTCMHGINLRKIMTKSKKLLKKLVTMQQVPSISGEQHAVNSYENNKLTRGGLMF